MISEVVASHTMMDDSRKDGQTARPQAAKALQFRPAVNQ